MRRLAAAAVFALALGAAGAPAGAAGPPGPEDWVRVEEGPLALEGPAAYRATLEELAGRARVFLPDLERDLGVELAGPLLMVLIPPDTSGYPDVARLDAAAPRWAAGFVLGDRRVGGIRIASAGRYPFGDAGAVLAHEVTHVLLQDAAGPRLPRWFAEGVSTREQREWSLRDAMVYSSSLLVGPLPELRHLDRAFAGSEADARLAYAASFDFVHWSQGEYGPEVVREVLAGTRESGFEAAWRTATGVPLARSEASWRRSSLALYRWVPVLTGAGTLWLGITALFLAAALRRRARTRELYERWDEEDAERRGQARARELSDPPNEEDAPGRGRDESGEWIH
jgi:hypothetical protein